MLACELDPSRFDVAIYERNAAPGRKFLVAGDGGFNLTHSENVDQFISRYAPPDFLSHALNNFSNTGLVKWLKKLGIQTYVGSSGRIFPVKGIKPIQVLSAILDKLKSNNVRFELKHTWVGF